MASYGVIHRDAGTRGSHGTVLSVHRTFETAAVASEAAGDDVTIMIYVGRSRALAGMPAWLVEWRELDAGSAVRRPGTGGRA